MSTQFFLAIELPRISIGHVHPVAAPLSVSIRVDGPAWPPAGGVQRQPQLRATWKVQDDRLTLVWA